MKPPIVQQVDQPNMKTYNSTVVGMANDFRDLTRQLNRVEKWIKMDSAYLVLLLSSTIREFAS